MKRCNGSSVSGREGLLLPSKLQPFLGCKITVVSRESVGTMALKYHWRGLTGTVCFCNLSTLDTAD